MSERNREFDAKHPVDLRQFDAALMAALEPVRDYYPTKTYAPSHPRLWLRVAEHGDPRTIRSGCASRRAHRCRRWS